jgi:hypothetical protein
MMMCLIRTWVMMILPWITHRPKAEVVQGCRLVKMEMMVEGPVTI